MKQEDRLIAGSSGRYMGKVARDKIQASVRPIRIDFRNTENTEEWLRDFFEEFGEEDRERLDQLVSFADLPEGSSPPIDREKVVDFLKRQGWKTSDGVHWRIGNTQVAILSYCPARVTLRQLSQYYGIPAEMLLDMDLPDRRPFWRRWLAGE